MNIFSFLSDLQRGSEDGISGCSSTDATRLERTDGMLFQATIFLVATSISRAHGSYREGESTGSGLRHKTERNSKNKFEKFIKPYVLVRWQRPSDGTRRR
jgi:fructose/tagatose bisphosphate aldolase